MVDSVMSCFSRSSIYYRRSTCVEIDAITAFLPLPALVEDVIGGKGDRFDVDRAQPLAGLSRGDVVGVAGDPQLAQAVTTRQIEQQPTGSLRVMMPAGGGVNVVSDVAQVHAQVVAVADAQ